MKKQFFGTDGIRGVVGKAPICPEWILKLGWAAGRVLSSSGHGKVLIGKDTRISGYMFESALEAGLAASGTDIYLLGPLPTPAIAYLTRTMQADAGIVISASHNHYQDNGIKFFSKEGGKLSDELELAIEQQLNKPMRTVSSHDIGKAKRIEDASGRYIEFCKRTFHDKYSLEGMKIILDCANGATYNVAPRVFTELGATVTTMGVTPDGLNINHECGSVHTKSLVKLVKEQRADLGIAFDGDGDRVIFVDHRGEVVNGDELLFIIAKWYQVTGMLNGSGVVGTVMSNLGLEQALAKLDIPFFRTKVGDRYIMQQLHKNNWLLGGEGSGHLLCLDAHTTGDGIISALRVLAATCELQSTVRDLKQLMHKYPQVIVNVPVESKKSIDSIPVIKQAILEAENILGNTGRVLLRPSGTEPVVRVMVEGQDESVIANVAENISKVVALEMQYA